MQLILFLRRTQLADNDSLPLFEVLDWIKQIKRCKENTFTLGDGIKKVITLDSNVCPASTHFQNAALV